MANQVVDTIVVGGGPAGCVVARNLAAAGQRVVLVARGPHPEDEWVRPDPFQLQRIDCILPEAGEHLESMGLLARINDVSLLNCPGIVCMRDESRPPQRQLTSFPPGFAWYVDRQRVENWLLQAACRAGVRTVHGAQVTWVRGGAGGYHVNLRCDLNQHGEFRQQALRCRYVVDASGQSSAVSRMLGRRKQLESRHMICRMVAARRCDDQDNRLWIERGQQGWFYAVPTANDNLQITFVAPPNAFENGWRIRVLYNLHKTHWLSGRVVLDEICSGWRCAIANTGALNTIAGENCIAVGDAAAALEPLAGQALSWAIGSGCHSARAILADADGDRNAIADYACGTLARFRSLCDLRAAGQVVHAAGPAGRLAIRA